MMIPARTNLLLKKKQKIGQQVNQKKRKKSPKLKRKSKWLLVDEDEVPKENQFLQIKRYTQESKLQQEESLQYTQVLMQMHG